MKYYLIDFDNVNTSKDLKGWETFTADYYIYLFYTADKAKIDVSLANKHGKAGFEYIEVPEGKQSLDMHLVSLLGFLVNKDKDGEYVIVSKDTDYDKIIKFWQSRENINITKCAKITPLKPEKIVADDGFAKAKTALNGEIQRFLSEQKYDESDIATVTKIVLECLGKDDFTANVHNELTKVYTNGSDVYNDIKSLLKKYSSIKKAEVKEAVASAPTGTKKNKPSDEIRKILKTAKTDADIINYVGNIFDSHYKEKDYKQRIYRAVVSKYGQNQGLDIYNKIKKSL